MKYILQFFVLDDIQRGNNGELIVKLLDLIENENIPPIINPKIIPNKGDEVFINWADFFDKEDAEFITDTVSRLELSFTIRWIDHYINKQYTTIKVWLETDPEDKR